MWVLDTDGDALNGKKYWLRPGQRLLIGRRKDEEGQVVITDKTVSKSHLVVEVGTVPSSDCPKPQNRSTLTLQDPNTKFGTLVNGEQIRNRCHVVSTGENIVALAKYRHHFTFTWVPVNLTISFTAKEARADPYSALYDLLGPLDIKVLAEYKRGVTTHLVAKKRNTSKGLQALIDGRYIVHYESYINALVAACTPPIDGSKTKSLLEEDWDGNFPDPLLYLPPRGEEPTQRDASAYSPNPDRQNMFEGYKFVFYEKRQFENLLAPITEGRGKALLQEAIPNETQVEEFVRYVKSVAGEKGLGEFEDGSEGKGVVVVRFNPVKGAGTEWFANFNRQVSLYLDHRLIEQNEFLDAILGTDASVLRRPLEFVQSGVVAPPPSAVTAMSSQTHRSSPQPSQPPASTPAPMAPPETMRRGRSRRTVTSRFKGFDEDFTGGILGSVPENTAIDPTPAVQSQSQGLFVSQDPHQMDVDRDDSVPALTEREMRKRSTPPMDYEDSQDFMDNVAPAAQAFKKRKLAEQAARKESGESTPQPAVRSEIDAKAKPRSKASKREINIQEVLAKKQSEEAARAEAVAHTEREALQETLVGMSIDEMRNLAIIEEMPVTRRAPQPRAAAQPDESDRWDERWNGRKNFKKFRRRGADPNDRRAVSRVIVQLEEVKKKDFGIGDDRWLEDADSLNQRKKKKGKTRDTQDTQTQTRDKSQSMPRGKVAPARATDLPTSEAEDEFALPDEEDVPRLATSSDVEITARPRSKSASSKPAPRSQRGSRLADKTNEIQNMPTQRGNKRAAVASFSKPAPAKKAKPAPAREEASDDDDSDDGLKFRFARRK